MYLKSDILFYVFHVVCGLHYDNVFMHVRAHLRLEKSTRDENECALYSKMTSRRCIMTFMKNFVFYMW